MAVWLVWGVKYYVSVTLSPSCCPSLECWAFSLWCDKRAIHPRDTEPRTPRATCRRFRHASSSSSLSFCLYSLLVYFSFRFSFEMPILLLCLLSLFFLFRNALCFLVFISSHFSSLLFSYYILLFQSLVFTFRVLFVSLSFCSNVARPPPCFLYLLISCLLFP